MPPEKAACGNGRKHGYSGRRPDHASAAALAPDAAIVVENVDIAYGSFVIQRDLNFTIRRGLDDLILELRASLGATMVMVTHELPSIFAIADNAVYLDAETRTMLATGDPEELVRESPDPKVRAFLTRGGKDDRSQRLAT